MVEDDRPGYRSARGVRRGLYGDGNPTANQLVENADESLLKRIMYNLQQFLPDHNGWSAWLSGRTSVSGQRSFAVHALDL